MTSPELPVSGRVGAGKKGRSDLLLAVAVIAPAFVWFIVFLLWPTLNGIWVSFANYNLLTQPELVGFKNYLRVLEDPVFWNAAGVTVYYVVVSIGVQTMLALLIAVLMHRLTQSTWVRSIVLTPYLVSNVVAALVFMWILDTQLGIGNQVLASMGLNTIPFLSQESTVIPMIALINVWRHMGYTVLLIRGLQTISESAYEAARVDGASEWRMFWRITILLLRPILALVLIMTIIGSFQVFDTVAIATQGGPVNSSRVLQLYIYDMAFGRFQFGYASAFSVALLLILVVITFFQYRLTRADETDPN